MKNINIPQIFDRNRTDLFKYNSNMRMFLDVFDSITEMGNNLDLIDSKIYENLLASFYETEMSFISLDRNVLKQFYLDYLFYLCTVNVEPQLKNENFRNILDNLMADPSKTSLDAISTYLLKTTTHEYYKLRFPVIKRLMYLYRK